MSVRDNGEITAPMKAPGPKTKLNIVLGAQWGDEGKGKLVDILATNADLVCRCQVRTRGILIACAVPQNPASFMQIFVWMLSRYTKSYQTGIKELTSLFLAFMFCFRCRSTFWFFLWFEASQFVEEMTDLPFRHENFVRTL